MHHRWIATTLAAVYVSVLGVGCKDDDSSEESEPVTVQIATASASVAAAPAPAPAPTVEATPVQLSTAPFPEPSAKKPTTGAGYTNITKCCNALRGNAKSAPPEQQGMYTAAANSCDNMKGNPAALSQIRVMTAAMGTPAACS